MDAFKATWRKPIGFASSYRIFQPRVRRANGTTIEVLKELGGADKEILTVYNKVDQVDDPVTKANAQNLGRMFVPAPRRVSGSRPAESRKKLDEGEVTRDYLIPHEQYSVSSSRKEACLRRRWLKRSQRQGNAKRKLGYQIKEFLDPSKEEEIRLVVFVFSEVDQGDAEHIGRIQKTPVMQKEVIPATI